MNIFELKLWDDEGRRCTFYTVQWDGEELSETDKFFTKYENDPTFKMPIQALAIFLVKKIANENGALKSFFRFENSAEALPPSGSYEIEEVTINYGNFPLRLYCLRISNSLVILFNGGEKTGQTAQEGKTSMVFHEANLFAKRITTALNQKEIYITEDGREFRSSEGSEKITL